MFYKMLLAIAGSSIALSALALDTSTVQKMIELKDGSTVHVFKDGKMGMEDKLGRAVRMEDGQVMETRDSQRITMVGDEVARLEAILRANYRGGR